MFIPYSVDVPFDRRPVMNWVICALVLLVFFLQVKTALNQTGYPLITQKSSHQAIDRFVLDGWTVTGLFGHMWIHGGIVHLIGNLIFLWLFGNAVCSKIGNMLYVPVYIGLGLVAGISHLLFSGGPAAGASGAINGIVGMYLVFFPQNSISCFIFIFFRPITFSVSGYWLILLWFVFDIIGAVSGRPGVAYFAHSGGFIGGFGVALIMLKYELVEMHSDEKSLLQILLGKKTKISEESARDLPLWLQKLKSEENINPTPSILQKPEKKYIPYICFKCQCGQNLKITGSYAGRTVKCPKCSSPVKVPDTSDSESNDGIA